MSPEISERQFEVAIECGLLAGGPDACATDEEVVAEAAPTYGGPAPGGYRRRSAADYDWALCLDPGMVLDFIYATQPRMWGRLKEHYGDEVKQRFLARLSSEIDKRGTLDVVRKGVRDAGCRFTLAYFQPSSGLNEELRRLYEGNVFSVIRQVRYSQRSDNSVDLVLFVNGMPVFTAELKNPLTSQTVEHGMRQYRLDRDPREPLFRFGRCLAHFAVDPDLVYFATQLRGEKTRFFPFNRGRFGGAGNPPALTGYATAYLWEQIWAKESVLDLMQHFLHVVEAEDGNARARDRALIFPRFHQLDAVRRLVAHARDHGPGQRYLIEHSAGSGKSNSIAWLAHRLAVLHDAWDRRVFDSIIVVTDRLVLDRQLQATVRQFEQTTGLVENIERTSRQLKEALQDGKTIVVTTLQKFPMISQEIGELSGRRFAVIIDEAHSSQTGEAARHLKEVLAAGSLEEAEEADASGSEDFEDRIVASIRARGPQAHVSTFAFTATPKEKTLELFGVPQANGSFEPFSLYTMRQAIEEGFILDVLEHYTTYTTYWHLLKTAEDDPRYERAEATYLLRSFVDLNEHAIDKKVAIMADHFHAQVARQVGGLAKAMVVTRSRLHAVRTRVALDAYLRDHGYPYRALVAFSGTVHDGGIDYTEAQMNGLPERQTAGVFRKPEYRFLVVANKFQTGFDEPLLHTMYVDKRLAGVNAVQTLSRLNRTYPGKSAPMVLDFANDAEGIRESFRPYYEKTILSEATDPNQLYDLDRRLHDRGVFTEAEVGAFAVLYFDPKVRQEKLYAVLGMPRDRFESLPEGDQAAFKGLLTDFVRLYAFLSQILPFADADLEKLYHFARFLRRYLPTERRELPREIQEKIDIESYAIRETFSGGLRLPRGTGRLEPIMPKSEPGTDPGRIEALSQIIRELNERFGTEFAEADKVFIRELEHRLDGNEALQASVRVNVVENARLTFDNVVGDRLQDMVETNFEFYKRVTDDPEFSKFFLDWLFGRYRERAATDSSGLPPCSALVEAGIGFDPYDTSPLRLEGDAAQRAAEVVRRHGKAL
jgi:type I restriction enzyme R subunit